MNIDSNILILGIGFLLSAIAAVSIGNYRSNMEKERGKWIKTDATILKRIERTIHLGSGNYLCKFLLTYEYFVLGERYEGSSFCAPEDYANTNEEMSERLQSKFKIGNSIEISINPMSPSKSTIYFDGASRRYGCIVFSVGFGIVLFVLLYIQ